MLFSKFILRQSLEGYRWTLGRAVAGWIAVVFCAGIPLILASWKQSILLKFTHHSCHPNEAHKVLLKASTPTQIAVNTSLSPLTRQAGWHQTRSAELAHLKGAVQRF